MQFMNLHFAKYKITILAVFVLLFSFSACVRSQSNHTSNSNSATPDSIDIANGYEPGHYIKGRVSLKKGDCLYIMIEQTYEAMPDEMEKRKEDSFYCPLYTDTLYSRYISDLHTIARIWPMLDSVNASMMQALIIREDTILSRQYLYKQDFEMPKDPIPLDRVISGLKRMDIREYRFKDREAARAAFRNLAFAPNVVMRMDSSWLHEDYGRFRIECQSGTEGEKYVAEIKKQFPKDILYPFYSEMQGAVIVNSSKAVYDKLKGYTKSEFKRPKRFSFVIYKKMED